MFSGGRRVRFLGVDLSTALKTGLRLVGRQQWDLPDDVFVRLPAAMLEIANDTAEKASTRIAAAKVVLGFHGQNQKDDPVPESNEGTFEERRQAVIARIG